MQFRVFLPIFTADGGHLGVYIHFWRSDFDRLSFTICLVGQKTVINLSSIFLGGEVVYRPVYIVVLTLWRPSWTPSWIFDKAPAGITGSFSMLFLMIFGRFPEKFSLGIFFSPSKPNTIRLHAPVHNHTIGFMVIIVYKSFQKWRSKVTFNYNRGSVELPIDEVIVLALLRKSSTISVNIKCTWSTVSALWKPHTSHP